MTADVTVTPASLQQGSGVGLLEATTTSTSFGAWPLLVLILLALVLVATALLLRLRKRRLGAAKRGGGASGGPDDTDGGSATAEHTDDEESVGVGALPGQRTTSGAPAPAPAPAPQGKVTRAVSALGTAVVALLVIASGAADAEPRTRDVWQGVLSVKSGTDLTPLDVITSGGCPLPATNVVGFVEGHGFAADTVSAGNNSAGVRNDGPFEIPLADSLRGLMDMQPHRSAFKGTYRISLYCITPGMEQTLGVYRADLRFVSPTRWKALPPVTRRRGPFVTSDNGTDPQSGAPTGAQGAGASGTAPQGSGKGSAKGPSGTASAPQGDGSTVAGGAAADTQRAAELSGVESGTSSDRPVRWPLIGLGLLALVAVVVWLARTRRTSGS